MKKLRIGIVGLGRVASKTHIPVLKSFENVEVVAGAERNPDRAKRVQQMFGLKAVFDDYEQMYAAGGLDAVYVCLPNFLHRDACRKALERGLHVLCEKPMCMSAEEAREITELADERKFVLMPGYKKRYAPNFAKAKALIDSGLLGNVVQIQGVFMTPGPYISWDPKSDWYLDPKWHGVIYDSGCHLVELLLYLVPCEVRAVKSMTQEGFSGYSTPTNVSCVFQTESGAVGDLAIGWRASTDALSVAVHGTAGSLTVSRDYLSYLHPGTDPVDKIKSHFSNAVSEVGSVLGKIRDKVKGKNFYPEDLRQAEAFCLAASGLGAPPVDGHAAVKVHEFLGKMLAGKSSES